jgi:hypothetical protein
MHCEEALRSSTAFHASEGTEFALAELGNDAGMYGAVKMVIKD